MRFTLPASLALILTVAASSMNAGQSAPGQPQVTFTKDIAPIFQENCQVCHRPGSIAPMSLLTYEDARPWARSIKQKVLAREMPPWFIDRNVGVQHFSNDRSLNGRDIQTISAWVDAGAPEGNPKDLPPPRQFAAAEAWQIGQPDVIVSLPKDYIVPAKAPDRWPDILVDPRLTEDRYIKGVQIIPTKGFTVIHHIRTSIVEPTDATLGSGQLDDADVPLEVGEQGVFLNEYAIGKQGDIFPHGSGRFAYEGLDRVIHERARLSILTSLASQAKGLGFADLKRLCQLTDGNLSRHMRILEEGGLVEIEKEFRDNRPYTTVRLSAVGRRRFLEYLTVLEKVIADAADAAGADAPGRRKPSKGFAPA
jgi:DNA-binding transcriptional ArsR family regulator